MSDTVVFETWKSQIRGREGVVRIGPDGFRDTELITGGSVFTVTPAERRLTEQECRNPKRNPFRNGIFAFLNSNGEDNPGETSKLEKLAALTDDEIDGLLTGHHNTVVKRISGIHSPYTLRRILAYGEAVDASPKRLKIVKDRIEEIEPKVTPAPEPDSSTDVVPRGVEQPIKGSYRPDRFSPPANAGLSRAG